MIRLGYHGFTYRKTPVELREKIVLGDAALADRVALLVGRAGIAEVYPLSTCNRTELYTVQLGEGEADGPVRELFAALAGEGVDVERYMERAAGLDAVAHLLEVAAGLDSMVMGEPQILGQVKEFYEKARHHQLVGTVLDRLLQAAIRAGKRAREETEIGQGAVSVSFAAVELARKIFGSFEHKSAALIGVGEMGALCARHLQANGVHKLYLLNRTFERSVELARELTGIPVPFEDLYLTLAQSDIVISSTAAPGFVIQAAPFREIVAARRREILLVDIAIPRDVEPTVGDLAGVFLYDIDDMEGIVDANLRKRQAEAEKVRDILHQESDGFARWLETLGVKPTIVALRERFESIRRQEIGAHRNLSPAERELAERITRGFMNKLLHTPVTRLKDVPTEADKLRCSEVIARLFDLEQPPTREEDYEH
jgi:glutamyl-tRNA reductase